MASFAGKMQSALYWAREQRKQRQVQQNGLGLGSETIVDPDFSTGSTEWTNPSSVDYSGGTCAFDGSGVVNVTAKNTILVPSVLYVIEIEIDSLAPGAEMFLRVGDGTISDPPAIDSVGTHIREIEADGSIFRMRFESGAAMTVSNVSVKPVEFWARRYYEAEVTG